MAQLSVTASTANPYFKAGIAALGALAMTTIHHAYGAAAYDTPWRLHIVFISVPVAIVFLAALYVGTAREGTPAGRIATWIGVAVILAFPAALIGFFEGGYNHVVKNVVYFVAGEEAMMRLVPTWLYDPSLVETPNDFIFEMTGVAQFPLGILTAVLALRLARHVAR